MSLDLWHLFAKEHQLIGSYGGTREDLRALLGLAASGRISPVIHDVVELNGAVEALGILESGIHFGKLVVSVDGGGRDGDSKQG